MRRHEGLHERGVCDPCWPYRCCGCARGPMAATATVVPSVMEHRVDRRRQRSNVRCLPLTPGMLAGYYGEQAHYLQSRLDRSKVTPFSNVVAMAHVAE